MKKLFVFGLTTSFALFSFISCNKERTAPVSSSTLDVNKVKSQRLSIDNEKAQAGRVLFYDKSLSVNNTISCGTCHQQRFAFSDGKKLSPGFDNRVGERNTPTIQNLALSGQNLFWDGREHDLKEMSTKPIFNHVEMGVHSSEALLNSIKNKPYYQELFRAAFPMENEITEDQIAECLMSFMLNLQSRGSRFDQANSGFMPGPVMQDRGPSSLITPIEEEGKELFFGKYNCGSCHNLFDPKGYNGGGGPIDPDLGDLTLPEFAPPNMKNIGLAINYKDKGMGAITGKAEDMGKFKIPNLRNVVLTGPYMHDGRFETLEEVIDFYNKGVQPHPNLAPELTNFGTQNSQVLSITASEKRKLIAFLNTLTDDDFINRPELSDPFIKN